MSKATPEQADTLHSIVRDHLENRILNGETHVTKKGDVVHVDCSASIIGHAIKWLADNGTKIDTTKMNDGAEIAAKIRQLAAEEEGFTYGPN